MKKVLIISSIVVLSATLTIIGLKRNQNQLPDFGNFLMNAEALAESESGQGNPWESNYQYCRCKKDNNNLKTCQPGNAISTKPACHKANIGVSLNCHDYDASCR